MFKLAFVWSDLATCPRLHAGIVVCDDEWHTLASGFNGSLPKQPHCEDPGVGCLMIDNHCLRTLHAEDNMLLHANRTGVSLKGAIAFITARPCLPCFKKLAGVGIKQVHYYNPYDTGNADDEVTKLSKAVGVPLWGPYERRGGMLVPANYRPPPLNVHDLGAVVR